MRLPAWLIGVFDPAQRYMERTRPRQRGRRGGPGRGWSSYAALTSDGVGGAARARPPEIEEMVRRRRAEHEARLDRVDEMHADALGTASRELATTGSAELRTPTGAVSARVARFRWGSSVLEIETRVVERQRLADGGGVERGQGTSSRTRVRRTGEDPDTYRRYLASALAELPQREGAD